MKDFIRRPNVFNPQHSGSWFSFRHEVTRGTMTACSAELVSNPDHTTSHVELRTGSRLAQGSL